MLLAFYCIEPHEDSNFLCLYQMHVASFSHQILLVSCPYKLQSNPVLKNILGCWLFVFHANVPYGFLLIFKSDSMELLVKNSGALFVLELSSLRRKSESYLPTLDEVQILFWWIHCIVKCVDGKLQLVFTIPLRVDMLLTKEPSWNALEWCNLICNF